MLATGENEPNHKLMVLEKVNEDIDGTIESCEKAGDIACALYPDRPAELRFLCS